MILNTVDTWRLKISLIFIWNWSEKYYFILYMFNWDIIIITNKALIDILELTDSFTRRYWKILWIQIIFEIRRRRALHAFSHLCTRFFAKRDARGRSGPLNNFISSSFTGSGGIQLWFRVEKYSAYRKKRNIRQQSRVEDRRNE